MLETTTRKRTIFKWGWLKYIGIFAAIQFFFMIFDRFPPRFREGTVLSRLSESTWFTEKFTFYDTPEFNILTVFFALIFLPSAMISAIKSLRQ